MGTGRCPNEFGVGGGGVVVAGLGGVEDFGEGGEGGIGGGPLGVQLGEPLVDAGVHGRAGGPVRHVFQCPELGGLDAVRAPCLLEILT